MICQTTSYVYSFQTKNWLARSPSAIELVILLAEALACYGYGNSYRYAIIAAILIASVLGFWDIYTEWPYYFPWIQGLNIALLCSQTLIVVLVGVASKCAEFPLLVSCVTLLPCSIVLGFLIRQVGLSQARTAITRVAETAKVDFNPNLLDVFLREMYGLTSMKFSFRHLYTNPSISIVLSAILAASNSPNINVRGIDCHKMTSTVGISSFSFLLL